MDSSNPFEEGYELKIKSAGMSSGDIQRNIFISKDRIRHLYDMCNRLEKEVNALRNQIQPKPFKSKKPTLDASN